MKTIKIFFEDCGPTTFCIDPIINIIKKDCNVVVEKNPDYLFFSSYGFNHYKRKYDDCVKIFYTYENTEPDFSSFDYGIGFQHLDAGDRYLRFPSYLVNGFSKLNKEKKSIDKSFADKIDYEKVRGGGGKFLTNRKFCNVIWSKHNSKIDPFRIKFFDLLNKYKTIDCGGTWNNNIGRQIGSPTEWNSKIQFMQEYKFSFALENSSLSGYTTEKIVHAMLANSIPLYYGNPDIEKDFNTKSMVFINDFDTMEAAVEEIIRLDKDDNAYMEKLQEPWYYGDDYDKHEYKLRLFFKNIFEKPIEQSKRMTKYGYIRVLNTRMQAVQQNWHWIRKIMKIKNYLAKGNLYS
ncbi:MAG: glycosyltransferase [Bacteroidales bacterium]|jgi:hypothetical protein|nr:glycosyltransferase [Bacteroidales bacterium]